MKLSQECDGNKELVRELHFFIVDFGYVVVEEGKFVAEYFGIFAGKAVPIEINYPSKYLRFE